MAHRSQAQRVDTMIVEQARYRAGANRRQLPIGGIQAGINRRIIGMPFDLNSVIVILEHLGNGNQRFFRRLAEFGIGRGKQTLALISTFTPTLVWVTRTLPCCTSGASTCMMSRAMS